MGEIENVLLQHPNIQHALVEVQKDSSESKQLVAYIALKNVDFLDQEGVKIWLKNWVPDSWIPSSFIVIEKLNFLPNGKIDRRSLPKVELTRTTCILPRTPEEHLLAEIWCELLQLKQVGINENFFSLGGNSLSITVAAMHVRKKFGKNISLRTFLEQPTIACLASLLNEQNPTQNSKLEEVLLPSKIVPQPGQRIHSSITHVLLTGATGFLGTHLLFDLLEGTKATIFCLVRAKNTEDAYRRLIQSFHRYFPETVVPENRVIVVPGDLSLRNLGIPDQEYQILAQKLDSIYHCGAHVHHVYDYKTLMAPNVLSVIEILKLASTGDKLKKVVYISTLSVAEEEGGAIQEKYAVGAPPSSLRGGYEQTKWMAEKLLAEASRRGIPIKIFRPGIIIGHSLDGGSSYENDHFLRLIRGCIQMKKAPDWEFKLDMLPVDFVSKIITKISLDDSNKKEVFNLSSQNQMSWSDLICWINTLGHDVKVIPYSEWKEALVTIEADNALFPLLSLYLGEAVNLEEMLEKKIDMRNTLDALVALQMSMPLIDTCALHANFKQLFIPFFAKKEEFSNET